MKIRLVYTKSSDFILKYTSCLKKYCTVLSVQIDVEKLSIFAHFETLYKHFSPDVIHCIDEKSFRLFSNYDAAFFYPKLTLSIVERYSKNGLLDLHKFTQCHIFYYFLYMKHYQKAFFDSIAPNPTTMAERSYS